MSTKRLYCYEKNLEIEGRSTRILHTIRNSLENDQKRISSGRINSTEEKCKWKKVVSFKYAFSNERKEDSYVHDMTTKLSIYIGNEIVDYITFNSKNTNFFESTRNDRHFINDYIKGKQGYFNLYVTKWCQDRPDSAIFKRSAIPNHCDINILRIAKLYVDYYVPVSDNREYLWNLKKDCPNPEKKCVIL